RIDPEARRFARQDAEEKLLVVVREVVEYALQRLRQELEPRLLGGLQLDHHVVALGMGDPHFPQDPLEIGALAALALAHDAPRPFLCERTRLAVCRPASHRPPGYPR